MWILLKSSMKTDPSQVFIDLAELCFLPIEHTDDGGNRVARLSLETSQTVKPGDEASLPGDRDRCQEAGAYRGRKPLLGRTGGGDSEACQGW